ncbi:cupin domain-containing protein [Carboxylicivirga sp. N1Y90]|uniref:cupin domain-containing protein n=1 Tax=Carboxylicivirga fragile TaxID=3417571 RepID=UPI003D331078|nr:cupin domain-containing protein [Marinilabiliaceae bacterium N1Y90]
MKKSSLVENIEYKENRPAINVLFESDTSKEIRIVFRKGQVMAEHKTSYPISVEIFEGEIEFGVKGEKLVLVRGDLVALDANVPHDLLANADSIVRLTLAKGDLVQRVVSVAKGEK